MPCSFGQLQGRSWSRRVTKSNQDYKTSDFYTTCNAIEAPLNGIIPMEMTTNEVRKKISAIEKGLIFTYLKRQANYSIMARRSQIDEASCKKISAIAFTRKQAFEDIALVDISR